MTQPTLPRRALLAAGSLATLGAFMPRREAAARSPSEAPAALRFPAGFRWGTATSSYQVEGAVNEDGRGPSIWDSFVRQPGRIADGSTGDVAADHYHRYKEDIALMKAMGAQTYRFSIAWPRLFPDGRGLNEKGIAFYDKLVDGLLEAGIEPFPTLYHWDLPQVLQDKGGWQARDTALALGDYAAEVARRLSDRVGHFFTLNEMSTFVELGYREGIFAPGLELDAAALNQVRHHAVLAHGLAVQAVRANAKPGTKVGPAENIATALPAVETTENIRAAELATRELNAPYLTVMLEGRYTDAYLAASGASAPTFTARDLEIIASPVDFVGLNVYTPSQYVVASEAKPGWSVLPFQPSHPHMASDWLRMGPESLYWAPRHAAKLWGNRDIYITENGTSAADRSGPDGAIYDMDRVMYLRSYLTQLQRATAEGVPVRGYFLWSLLDNFEWADGYSKRFGVVHVDFATQKRTPKLSASFYREVIARNATA